MYDKGEEVIVPLRKKAAINERIFVKDKSGNLIICRVYKELPLQPGHYLCIVDNVYYKGDFHYVEL